MKLCHIVPILAIGVLICGQLVHCDSEDNETAEKTTESSSVEEVTTEAQQFLVASTSDVISYNDNDVEKFFESLKKQLKCGYPKFGIPGMVPLKLSYRFKTSLDVLNLKKVQISASNFVIHGLDNFLWKSANTSFTRSKSHITVNFPNITIYADTSLNRANGTSRMSLYDTLVYLDAEYEEKDGLLYLTDINGDVKLAHLFPKSAKLTKIWNKAIGDSIPVLTRLITTRKISVDFINRLINGSKYYAISTTNNALSTYRLDFDELVASLKRFSEMTDDSLMCSNEESVGKSRVI
ncbi:hypothetical protein quinque_005437 [Culex quinquefasciatus]